jgi:hypothetical protein
MQQIEPIGAHQNTSGATTGGAPPLPHYLATELSASVIAQVMLGANVVAQAKLAIPPTPAALLDISPANAGLIQPVVSLSNHLQLLLLGEQSLEMIFTDSAQPTLPQPQAEAAPAVAANAAATRPGATLNALA